MRLVEDQNKRLKFILNFIVIVIAFIGISRKSDTLRETSAFENIMIDSFAPVQKGVVFLNTQVTDFFQNYVANISASKENKNLKNQVGMLESKIFELSEIEKENQRLKKLLEFGGGIAYKRVLAQVVAWDGSSDFQVIRINKGFSEGVRLQSPVVTADGLVGYIFRLTDHFADILTILDSNNRVDGLIQRVRAHGIIEGYSGNKALMKYVSRTEPVILNDQVITSGLGNVYPKGIRVGRVTRIEKESFGITQQIELTPSVDFGRLEEVIVLVGENDQLRKKEWEALDQMDEGEGN